MMNVLWLKWVLSLAILSGGMPDYDPRTGTNGLHQSNV
jgi:hypothetical protein